MQPLIFYPDLQISDLSSKNIYMLASLIIFSFPISLQLCQRSFRMFLYYLYIFYLVNKQERYKKFNFFMTTIFSGDAKYQAMDLQFFFDELNEKLVINAHAEKTHYRIEVESNPYLDFEDLKTMLQLNEFKIVSKNPQVLKIKVGPTNLEFKNVQKMTLDSLKQTVTELKNKLKDQIEKNNTLESSIKQLKTQFQLMASKISDLKDIHDMKETLIGQAKKIESQEQKMINQQQKIKGQQMIIENLQSSVTHVNQLTKTISENHLIREQDLRKNTELSRQIQLRIDQREKADSMTVQQFQKMEEQIKLNEDNIKLLAGVNPYIFGQCKSDRIELKDQDNVAIIQSRFYQIDTLQDENHLALISGIVLKKGSSIRLKIEGIRGSVSVGLAIDSMFGEGEYLLKDGHDLDIGHGCFLISFTGWSYSHSNRSQNNKKQQFTFQTGDVIRIQTEGHELLFVNETNDKEFRMTMEMKDDEFKQAMFCVMLDQKGDCASIVW